MVCASLKGPEGPSPGERSSSLVVAVVVHQAEDYGHITGVVGGSEDEVVKNLFVIVGGGGRIRHGGDGGVIAIPVRHSTAQGVPRYAQGVAALRVGGGGSKDIRLG